MEEALQLIKYNFKVSGNQAISLSLVCAAILILLSEKEKGSRAESFLKYEILFFLLLVNPFVFNDVSAFWFGEDYWKIFLMLLPAVCIAAAIAEIMAGQKKIWHQVLVFSVSVVFVLVSMNFNFHVHVFELPENSYKVSDEILAVDTILREQEINTEKMIAPREVCAEIREINAGINLLYGEDLIELMIAKKAVSEDEDEQAFFDDCASIVAVPEAVPNQINMAQKYGSNCMILDIAYDEPELMREAGYRNCGETNRYVVYLKETDDLNTRGAYR